ncbi:MAG: hypothetical protein WC910_06520, partial [Bacteroidales bacterium]
ERQIPVLKVGGLNPSWVTLQEKKAANTFAAFLHPNTSKLAWMVPDAKSKGERKRSPQPFFLGLY